MQRFFQDSYIFEQDTFLTVSTSSEQLSHLRNKLDSPVTSLRVCISSEQPLHWSGLFSRTVTISRYFFTNKLLFRSKISTEQLLFQNKSIFRQLLSQNSQFFGGQAPFSWQKLLQSITLFRTANFLTKLLLQCRYLLLEIIFQKSFFFWKQLFFHKINIMQQLLFRRAALSKRLISQTSYFFTTYLSRGTYLLLHFLSTDTFPVYCSVEYFSKYPAFTFFLSLL